MRARVGLCIAALLMLGGARGVSETERNRAIVTDFARLFYTEKRVRDAFVAHVMPGYIQHNPGIADGRDAAIAALESKFSRPEARFEVQRILVDGDHALIHLRARSDAAARGAAVADIYRLKDGKIVEHWDVLQVVPPDALNANTMF